MDGRSGAHHSGRSRISRRFWGSVTQIEPSPEARKNGVVRGSRRWDVTSPVAGLARSTEVHGYSTGTAQAVLDHAPPGARLVFSCGWHITRDGQDVYSWKLKAIVKVFGPLARLARFADLDAWGSLTRSGCKSGESEKCDRVFGPHATGRDRSLLPSAKNRAARHGGRVDESEKESTGGTCVPPVCVSLRYGALCQMPNTAPVGSWMIAKRPIFGTSIGSLRIVAPSSFARATVASASCVAM